MTIHDESTINEKKKIINNLQMMSLQQLINNLKMTAKTDSQYEIANIKHIDYVS